VIEEVDVRVAAPPPKDSPLSLEFNRAVSATVHLGFSNDPSTTTAADGTFTLETTEPLGQIIAESDQGIVQTPLDQFTEGQELILQPWGKIEGTLNHRAKPLAGQKIALIRNGRLREQTEVTTDAQGRFAFDRVAPGTATIAHAEAKPNPSLPIDVKPGETLTLDLGRTGRDVKGRFAIPTTPPASTSNVTHVGTLRRTGGQASPPTPASPFSRVEEPHNFPIASDGSFDLKYVWPGSYELRIMRQEREGQRTRAQSVATTNLTITENDPTTPLDLGAIPRVP
jgi:hypothetical protein